MANKLILITGGIKSGKSRFAEEMAQGLSRKVLYIATAQALDLEMKSKISLHQERRPDHWITVEEPYDIKNAIEANSDNSNVILIDCIPMLISNLIFSLGGSDCDEISQIVRQAIFDKIQAFAVVAKEVNADVIVVSNEIGLTLVAENKLARHFQEVIGESNQMIATYADEVYMIVSGCPMQIKGGKPIA